MTSQGEQQTYTIYPIYPIYNIQYTIQYTIYNIPNISTSKGNRVIGFAQVQKYGMRIFFLKKSCRN